MRSPWKGRGPMGKTVTLTGLIVALALAGCGSDSMEQRSGRTECPHVQQGHTYAVCGGVAIQEPPRRAGLAAWMAQGLREPLPWWDRNLRCGEGPSLGRNKLKLWWCVVLLGALPWAVHAATYSVTYRGTLLQDGLPADGVYRMQFQLYADESTPTALGDAGDGRRGDARGVQCGGGRAV